MSQQLIEDEIEKQKQFIRNTIEEQEKERLKIGKELHDNINQHLNTTRLYLEVAKDKTTGEALEMIDLAYKGLSDIIKEIRQLSQSLVPSTLGDLGLVETVKELCEALKNKHSFNIRLYHKHFNEKDLPGNMKLMFFRVIQEQINNIVHHGQVNSIHISLQSDAEYISLMIADNGQGFDRGNYQNMPDFSRITNRVELFNGKAEIDTVSGQGCTLYVTVPRIIY